MQAMTREALLAALRLQVEWGADEALEAAPADRLAPRAEAAAAPARSAERRALRDER
jgi:DNA polymerase